MEQDKIIANLAQSPFKTAFKAYLGILAAQLTILFVGIGLLIFAALIFSNLK